MAITALTNIPQTSDPANFPARADDFLGVQLPRLVTEVNDATLALNLNSVNTTSVTSNVVGTGSKTFTVGTGKSILGGMFLTIADTAAPSTNNMYVQVTSYVSGTGALVVNVIDFQGTGTKTAWTIAFSGGFYDFPDSYVRLNTANTYGTTNTMIRRFTNIVNQGGGDITYADSATLGGSFTINTTGTYSISYSDQFTAVSGMGVSLNSATLTTAIGSLLAAEILAVATTSAANLASCATFTGLLSAGAVVRAHAAGTTTGTQTTFCQFTIARVN